MGQDPEQIQREIAATRERMGDRVDAITYKTDVKSRVGDSISEKRDAITGKVSNLVSGVTGKASDISDQAPSGDELKGHATRAAGVAKDNPLGLALGAVAVGFLVGLAVPATRIEDERLGQASDTIKQKAMETGQEALNRGQQVAKDVAQSAAQTARESGGQHASELADTAKENASEAKQGAQSSIQSQSQG
ncbi:MAG: DUF3618 domain-containing protein [Candidatus Dormibacter sp.]|uniref:DUF3618 domain-containing protein n=1 Tax=Candidatus Dormibacter sp. TaxID=2973982 RepID=UPI000DB7B7E2|nr:MAG: hypothetical protein DLM66_00450 [Candidatus Dormibacteraeota bacterium]